MGKRIIRREEEIKTAAEEILSLLSQKDTANVLTLSGPLGAGKTTFIQAFAQLLGVTEHVTSPTFVLMRSYVVSEHAWIHKLVHIDAYRIEDLCEIQVLDLENLFQEKDVLICIEWPERIEESLPPDVVAIRIAIGGGEKRIITYGD